MSEFENIPTTMPQDEPQAQDSPAQSQENATETPEQINWKRFREEKDRDRKEKMAAEARQRETEQQNQALRMALEAAVSKPASQLTAQEKRIVAELPKGEFVTGDEISSYLEAKVAGDVERRVAEALDARDKQRQQERRERESKELPSRIKAEHRDFSDVCTTENLDYLEFHHPELARSLAKLPETVDKWSDIYKAVKRYVPNATNNRDQRKADINMAKPKSPSVSGMTASSGQGMSQELTADRKKANWERMQRLAKS